MLEGPLQALRWAIPLRIRGTVVVRPSEGLLNVIVFHPLLKEMSSVVTYFPEILCRGWRVPIVRRAIRKPKCLLSQLKFLQDHRVQISYQREEFIRTDEGYKKRNKDTNSSQVDTCKQPYADAHSDQDHGQQY